MSLVRTVTTIIAKRGRATVDGLMAEPDCEGYRRKQIITALKNAATAGHVHCVDRVPSPRGAKGRIGVYESGPAPSKPVRRPALQMPVNSVFQLGERAAACAA
jgi:hypothetical protein